MKPKGKRKSAEPNEKQKSKTKLTKNFQAPLHIKYNVIVKRFFNHEEDHKYF